MCNHLWIERQQQKHAEKLLDLRLLFDPASLGEKHPTDQIGAIFGGEAHMVRWGLIPSWAKEQPTVLMTNARAESVAEKPAFRGLLDSNRCLIPATGFYEWPGKHKTAITRADGETMFFAGLWDEWRGQKSATIITTDPSEWMASIHFRMPLILEVDEALKWLNGGREEALSMVRIHDPALVAESADGQGSLF